MSVKIRFATDFTCPYCIAAKAPLLRVLARHPEAELELLPLELTRAPKERPDTYHDEERKARWAKELIPFCKEQGLEHLHIPPHVIPRPYTTLAWHGWHYACTKGKGNAYADLMYEAYFGEELDIGDMDVLVSLAQRLGLDGEEFRTVVESGVYTEAQDAAVAATRALDVKSIPTIWIGDLRLTGSLFTEEDYEFYLNLAQQGSDGDFSSGFACGPDGC